MEGKKCVNLISGAPRNALPGALENRLGREAGSPPEMEPFFPLVAAVYTCHLLYSYLSELVLSGSSEPRPPFWGNLLIEGCTGIVIGVLVIGIKYLLANTGYIIVGRKRKDGRTSKSAANFGMDEGAGSNRPGGGSLLEESPVMMKHGEAPASPGPKSHVGGSPANSAKRCPELHSDANTERADSEEDGLASMPSSTSLLTDLGVTPGVVFPRVTAPAPVPATSISQREQRAGPLVPPAPRTGVWKDYLLLAAGSFLISLSKVLCELSLSYVSYPLYQIFKVSKALGMLLVDLLTGNTQKITSALVWTVIFTVAGSICYSLGEMTAKGQVLALGRSGASGSRDFDYSIPLGVLLLVGSQVAVGLSGICQDHALGALAALPAAKAMDVNVIQVFNGVSTVLLSLCLGASLGFPGAEGITRRAVKTGVLVNTLLCVGEVPVLLFLRRYGSLRTTLMTTVRKVIALLLSIALFHHEVNALALLGIALTLIGVVISSLGKYLAHSRFPSRRKARRGRRTEEH